MLDSIPLALAVLMSFTTPDSTGPAPRAPNGPLSPRVTESVEPSRMIPPPAARIRLTPTRHDPWFAQDKAKHFTMSFAATGFSFAAARTAGLGRDGALVAAGVAALTAGVGKELYDRRTGGFFSVRDMVWNVAGIAAGLVLAANTR